MTTKTKLILISIMLLAATNGFSREKGFIISGEVVVHNSGAVFIALITEDNFKTPMTGYKTIVIQNKDNRKGGRTIAFQFTDVEQGIYGIRCYQDINDNGKLDKGLFGPKEPWWLSWKEEKHSIFPRFKDIAFIVNSNIENIRITPDI